MQLIFYLAGFWSLCGLVSPLGGKPFGVARRDMTGKNYAVLALCDDVIGAKVAANLINVSLALRSDVGEVLEKIQFRDAKEPIEVGADSASNITELILTADVAPVPYNIRKVSVRIGHTLFKLHINQECDDEEEFMTSTTEQTFWSRRIDCERKDVYCDDRNDEFMGCENVFVYHLTWKRGATGRHKI